MKQYILKYGMFALAMVFASAPAFAQDDEVEEEEVVRKVVKVKRKQYDTRTVTGRVVNAATGTPMSGVIVKATEVDGYSGLTDDNGIYTVKVPVFSTGLYISTPDFNAATIGLSDGESQKEVALLPVAFKPDYTSEVDILNKVSADDFKYTYSTNIKEEVQNQLGAYAYSTSRSGSPGQGLSMFIQGLNSLNANAQPLVVVDGVIIDQQYDREQLHSGFYNDILTSINPADIANVEVMRNGTALYGARGANGVILVTTKRSTSMATRITASASVGINMKPKLYDMMDAEQYRGYASEMLGSTNTKRSDFKFLSSDPSYPYYNRYHASTDWKDYIYRTSVSQNYGINVMGGDDVAQYNLSVGYTRANSTLKYNDMNRINIRFNSDISLTSKLDIRFDASFANTTRSLRDDTAPSGYTEGTPTSPAFMAYVKSPFMSPYAYGYSNGVGSFSSSVYDIEDESYLDEALAGYANYNYRIGNPVAFNEYGDAEHKNRFETSMLNLSITPKFQILPNLSVSEHFTYNLINTNNKYYIPVNGVPTYYVASVNANRENLVASKTSRQNSIQSDTRLNWKNQYEAHSLSAFGGLRMMFENYNSSAPEGYNTGSDKTPFLSNGLLNVDAKGVDESWRSIDVYGQANYNYRGKYYAQVNLTCSSSSRFGKHRSSGAIKFGGVPWGIFPAVQLGWVLTNEPWLSKVQGIDYLKVTGGFDVSGNDDISLTAARSYFASELYLKSIAGLTLASIGNNDIKWETTTRWNAGIEGNFLNNRLHFGFNVFTSTTSDLLSLQTMSMLAGIDQQWANSGKMRNAGYDINFSGKVLVTKDWSWSIGASMGHYKNKIISLGRNDGKDYVVTPVYNAYILTKEGNAANLFYGYKTKGVYATTEQAKADGMYILSENGVDKYEFGAGDMIFDDVNGDKRIDENDMQIIGDPNPDFYGNIFTSVSWKRFKMDVNFNYSVGNDIYNYMRSQLEGGSRFMNQTTNLTQRWQAEGNVTEVPKITFQDPMGNSRFSDRWIEDGSYLKLKSITLSYNLPMNTSFLQGLEFWVQGNNLFTITKYLGSDPEVSITNSVIGQGIDYGKVGSSRSVVFGVKVKL